MQPLGARRGLRKRPHRTSGDDESDDTKLKTALAAAHGRTDGGIDASVAPLGPATGSRRRHSAFGVQARPRPVAPHGQGDAGGEGGRGGRGGRGRGGWVRT